MAIEHEFGLPLVEINLEFSAPVEAGDEVTIELTTRLGTTSVRFDYVATAGGETAFSGYEQRVCAERDGGPIPLPDDFRTAIAPYERD
jgi:4-hydroxybenzoyl-CoA thioesterase